MEMSSFVLLLETVVFEQALHLCELRGNHNAVAFIYGNIATAYCDWNRPGDAIPFSEKAVEYALKTGNKRRIGTCYVNLGAIQTRLVQMRAEGIATLLKAIPILEEVNDRRLLCDAYNYLVNAYRMDGNLNQAMYYLQKLDKLAHEMHPMTKPAVSRPVNANYPQQRTGGRRSPESDGGCRRSSAATDSSQ